MNKNKLLFIRYLSWGLTALIMIILFNLSAQTRAQSASLSGSITKEVIKFFYKDIDSLPKEELASIMSAIHVFIRKAAHFTAYFFMGVFSLIAMHTYNCKRKIKVAVCLAVGLAYAIFDELHQLFVPGRGPGVFDVALDFFGCASGALVVLLVIFHYERRKKL